MCVGRGMQALGQGLSTCDWGMPSEAASGGMQLAGNASGHNAGAASII